ncbi:hypothetical protein OF83DRAFT_832463 [Amylostereum chailletii]|nr:hypothetical protein OF83DRAFT_832463 [Amylostereum chailletii]
MSVKAAHSAGQIVRARASISPHRSPTVSALLWSLSTPSAPFSARPLTSGYRSALRGSSAHGSFIRPAARGMAVAVKRKPQDEAEIGEEEMLDNLDRMLRMEDQMPADVWNQRIETLDVQIPKSALRAKDASVKERLGLMWDNTLNWYKNVQGMYQLAKTSFFPTKSPRSFQIFQWRSTKQGKWVAPLRANFLDIYTAANTAMAEGNPKKLKELTRDEYAESALERTKRFRESSNTYRWKLHGIRSPVEIVSIRATPANYSRQEPKTGNRLLVHALVKFDTLQTLHVYNRAGKPVKEAGQTVPKAVVEYLVFERRLWYNMPWVIKDRVFEQ